MSTVKRSIELTVVLVPDQKTAQVSAFFAEFPEAIAVGDNNDDASQRLFNLFAIMLNDRRHEMLSGHINNARYESKQANLELA